MLTVKEPIRLQCATGQIAVRDDFGDRIRENYSLLSVQFTPKELLLLLSAPPEESEEQPGMTTLVTQSKVSLYQGVSLEVVNHIINRILLTQHTPFTYQDTVYISSMLRKAGITDVSLFMRQVRQMVAQSDSVNRLTAIYQLYQNRLPLSERVRSQTKRSTGPKSQTGEKETLHERYFLHSEIYRRLQTSDIYREVGALLTGTSTSSSSVEVREMRLAEQFRVSSELRLAELRQHTVDRDRPMTLQYTSNHYERGDLLPAPENEPQVFARLSEAVLYNTVEKALAIALHRGTATGALTLDLRQVLQQSIDDTVFRFENWYAETPIYGGMTLLGDETRTTLLSQEQHLLEQLLHRREHNQYTQMRQGDTVLHQTRDALSLTLRQQDGTQQMVEVPVEAVQETLREVLLAERVEQAPGKVLAQIAAQLGRRVAALTGGTAAMGAKRPASDVSDSAEAVTLLHDLSQTEQTRLIEQFDRLDEATREMLERRYQERVREVRQRTGQVSELELQHILTETLYSTEETLREQTETERTRHTSESTTLAHNAREVLERMRRLRAMYQSDRVTEQQTAEQTTHLSQTEQQMQLVQNKTVQTDTQTLREQLDQIDRHNREMLERVQRARIREIERKHTETRRVDTSRVMQDALRALDHPEQVMGELMAQAAPSPQPRLQLSPDAQTLLSQADEPTRRMLEAVMQYEANPSAGLPLPMQLQTATPAAFNAATAAVENEPPHDSGQAAAALPDEMRQAMVHEAAQEVIHRVPQHQAADHMPMDNAPLSLLNAAPVDVFTTAEAQVIPMQNGSTTSVSVLSEEHQTLVHEAAQEVVRHALPRQTVRSTPQHSGPQPVQFVHKTEQRAVSEEILNQLEQQRQTVRQTEQTQVTEQHERMETRQIEQTQRRTVERMSEDVTELINRTLARQLGTISDKVYSQMEKRLRMERARRGR